MKLVYEFHGGELNRKRFESEQAEAMAEGHNKDCSALRALGMLCQREELDNQPTVPGYLGPMWDGVRYVAQSGEEYYAFQLNEEQKAAAIDCFGVLRYETQEVYDVLSR